MGYDNLERNPKSVPEKFSRLCTFKGSVRPDELYKYAANPVAYFISSLRAQKLTY